MFIAVYAFDNLVPLLDFIVDVYNLYMKMLPTYLSFNLTPSTAKYLATSYPC